MLGTCIIIWFIFGVLRYAFDNDVKSDVTVYRIRTVFFHGPWWWILYIFQVVLDFFSDTSLKWKALNKVLPLDKKEE